MHFFFSNRDSNESLRFGWKIFFFHCEPVSLLIPKFVVIYWNQKWLVRWALAVNCVLIHSDLQVLVWRQLFSKYWIAGNITHSLVEAKRETRACTRNYYYFLFLFILDISDEVSTCRFELKKNWILIDFFWVPRIIKVRLNYLRIFIDIAMMPQYSLYLKLYILNLSIFGYSSLLNNNKVFQITLFTPFEVGFLCFFCSLTFFLYH